ncbi:MAG: ribosome silencing factor [Eubacteriales bacterium]|nr:ribosome silencing factor [Eubacteriales bacterium]
MTEQTKMAATAYAALEEKKGQDIRIIQISEISVMADYFIIASAGSTPQVQALMNNVEEKMHEQGYALKRIEGTKNSSWVLMDFGDVVVHIFDMEDRLFYDLERIWSDGKIIDPAELQ